MPNQPYIAFYTGDWKKDPELSLCSPATRGIWMDLLCAIHDCHTGEVHGTYSQLARMSRCNEEELKTAIAELSSNRAANIEQKEGLLFITCRRMKKAAEIKKIRAEAGSKGGQTSASKREQNPDTDIDNEGITKVREFARGEGIPQSDADWFYWKGRANGWTNGGKPMLDWKATLRSWRHAGYLPSQKNKKTSAPPVALTNKTKPAPLPQDNRSEEEVAKSRDFARAEVEKLRQKFKFPTT